MSQETRNQDFSIFLDTKSFLRGKVESDLLDSTELPLYSEIGKNKDKAEEWKPACTGRVHYLGLILRV